MPHIARWPAECGAFIPLIGAVVAGFLAVVVALLAKGIGYALITVGLLIAVNQLEAHLMRQYVSGRPIHPATWCYHYGWRCCRSRRRPVGRPDGRFNNAVQVLLGGTGRRRQMFLPITPPRLKGVLRGEADPADKGRRRGGADAFFDRASRGHSAACAAFSPSESSPSDRMTGRAAGFGRVTGCVCGAAAASGIARV